MRTPTPVTTRSMTAESASYSTPNWIVSAPDVTQVQIVVSAEREASGVVCSATKLTAARTKAASTTPQPTAAMSQRGSHRPARPSATQPSAGSNRIIGVRLSISGLPLQRIELVHVDLTPAAEDGDDDR